MSFTMRSPGDDDLHGVGGNVYKVIEWEHFQVFWQREVSGRV